MSSAFDTLNHETLLNTLHSRFGIDDTVLSWFKSYLSNRCQQVSVHGKLSQKFDLDGGVPQGSCLGPLLFILYTSSLFDIIETQLPNVHCYADDTQLYLSFCPNDAINRASALSAMEGCIHAVHKWMHSNSLMLNDSKTEFIIIGTRQQLAKVNIDGISVGATRVSPSPSVRNLGAWFDANMSMATHITKTCGTAFYYLHNIRRIR